MTDDFTTRRRLPRIPSGYLVLVRALDEKTSEGLVRTQSLGLGGCGFVSEVSYGVGSILELIISLDLRPLSVPGRVVYENPHPRDSFEVGIEFLELDHDERQLLEGLLNQDIPGT